MKTRLQLVTLLALLSVTGCTCLPRLKAADVREIADAAAVDAGRNLAEYEEPWISFDFEPEQHWSVFYNGKVLTVGNHFVVIIDDETREARVGGGE